MSFEKVLLHLIPLISKHKTVVIIPLCIIQIMYIMNICSRYIIRVNNTTYSTDSVELIPIVIHLLGGAKAFGRCALRIIISHNATLGSCQLAYFDRLGVYHKDIFPPSMLLAISLRMSSARQAVSLRRTLNCLLDIRLGICSGDSANLLKRLFNNRMLRL